MKLRIFWGFVLGTVLNAAIFGTITWANGTPVPSVRTPVALLTYPTDSVWLTVVMAWVIYTGSLIITCWLIPPAREKTGS